MYLADSADMWFILPIHERIYILSLGSQSANSHVHWHVAPLPKGVPFEQQQYHALMHENGVIETTPEEMTDLALKLQSKMKEIQKADA